MAGVDPFLDTNVLVYLFDRDEPRKQGQAQALLADLPPERVRMSVQVLGEFYVNVTQKLKRPLDAADARAAVEDFARFRIQPLDQRLVLMALARHRQDRLSYWDALIVEAAIASGADVLYTEDLQHGKRFGELEVVNPFLE